MIKSVGVIFRMFDEDGDGWQVLGRCSDRVQVVDTRVQKKQRNRLQLKHRCQNLSTQDQE